MKKILIMSILCSILGFLGCNARNSGFKTVDAKKFAELIADTNVFLLDVRTTEEYNEGHIKGAVNIDVMKADFEKKACSIIPEGKTVALYCRSGNRSKRAAAILADKYKVIELGSGYIGWLDSRPSSTSSTTSRPARSPR